MSKHGVHGGGGDKGGGITSQALKENGFSMTAGGEIFHWYSGQKVHVNQSVTLDNGTVFEQTKTYEASRGTVHDVANTIVISSNTSESYDLGMGILFEDNRGLDGQNQWPENSSSA